MAIFKQAAPLPIEHSAISQGLDDYYHPDPTMEDAELSREIDKSYSNIGKKENYNQHQALNTIHRVKSYLISKMRLHKDNYEVSNLCKQLYEDIGLIHDYVKDMQE